MGWLGWGWVGGDRIEVGGTDFDGTFGFGAVCWFSILKERPMERVLRDPESLGGSGSPKPMISPPKPAVFQPGSLTTPTSAPGPSRAGTTA